jgi:hypothetical protein
MKSSEAKDLLLLVPAEKPLLKAKLTLASRIILADV